MKFLARFEANRFSGRNSDLLARTRIAADTALARLDLKHTEAAELDPFASLHGEPHRIEHRVHRHLGLDLGDVGDLRNLVHDIDLDHA